MEMKIFVYRCKFNSYVLHRTNSVQDGVVWALNQPVQQSKPSQQSRAIQRALLFLHAAPAVQSSCLRVISRGCYLWHPAITVEHHAGSRWYTPHLIAGAQIT
jgi:hypothetical protein